MCATRRAVTVVFRETDGLSVYSVLHSVNLMLNVGLKIMKKLLVLSCGVVTKVILTFVVHPRLVPSR